MILWSKEFELISVKLKSYLRYTNANQGPRWVVLRKYFFFVALGLLNFFVYTVPYLHWECWIRNTRNWYLKINWEGEGVQIVWHCPYKNTCCMPSQDKQIESWRSLLSSSLTHTKNTVDEWKEHFTVTIIFELINTKNSTSQY